MFADSEYVDGTVPVATYKEGLPYRRRDSGKGNGFPRDRKIRNFNKNCYQSLPLLPHPNGTQVTDGKHPSEQLSAYNRLLRAGR